MNQPINNNFPSLEVLPPMPQPVEVAPAERYIPVSIPVETIDGGRPNYWEVFENPYSIQRQEQDYEMALEARRWEILTEREKTMYGNDAEVLQKVLKEVSGQLDQSDIYNKFQRHDFPVGHPTQGEWRQLFTAIDRARQYAFAHVEMSNEQRERLLRQTSELNRTIRQVLLNGAENAIDCMTIVEPGAVKIRYMSARQIIDFLKRSGTTLDVEQLKRRVQLDKDALAEHQDLPQVQAALADPDFPSDYDDLGESGLPLAA